MTGSRSTPESQGPVGPVDAVVVLDPPTWPGPYRADALWEGRTVVVGAGRPARRSEAAPDAVVRLSAVRGRNGVAIDDLTGLSMRLEEALSAGDGGLLRVDDLDRLAVVCDLPRLVRFLQAEIPRATRAGYAVRARFDPAAVDDPTEQAVTATFDRRLDPS